MNFLLDENVPLSIKQTINKLGHVVITLHDLNMLGIHNGQVVELALNKNAIIVTLDSDFLQLKKDLQKESRIIYIQIHPRDPNKIRKLFEDNFSSIISKLNTPCKIIISKDKIDLELV